MVDADGQRVARQMAEHDDHVRPQPVGEHGNEDGYADEQPAPLERLVIEIGEQRADHQRGDQITHTTTRFDDRPVT